MCHETNRGVNCYFQFVTDVTFRTVTFVFSALLFLALALAPTTPTTEPPVLPYSGSEVSAEVSEPVTEPSFLDDDGEVDMLAIDDWLQDLDDAEMMELFGGVMEKPSVWLNTSHKVGASAGFGLLFLAPGLHLIYNHKKNTNLDSTEKSDAKS